MRRESEKDRCYDRTYVSVDLAAIRHNIQEEKRILRKGTEIMAIVKANAYGHGAVQVSRTLYDLVDAYGVATAEEAFEIRQAGIDKEILILGFTPESWYPDMISQDISLTVYTKHTAEVLSREAMRQKKRARIHIKVDTGMSRIGFLPDENSIAEIKEISNFPNITIEGIFTHFARADEKTTDAAKEPLQQFCRFCTRLESEGVRIPVHHAANSASIIGFPEAHMDMVRSGITTYGLYPSEDVSHGVLDLKPAMEWKTVISHIKRVMPGTEIGYGGTYIAEKEMLVATIPVGYADGLKRDLSNKGHVLIRGKSAKIIGRICMDQFMADVSEIEGVCPGDTVTLFGSDGEAFLSVEEVAEMSHSFNYEFVCGITERVPRKY